MKIEEAIQEYQCPGCGKGPYPECFRKSEISSSCDGHYPGTIRSSFGTIFLGMPKGFNRLGPIVEKACPIAIFENESNMWEYDKFNVPCWKYLDVHGNTIIRGLSPRINMPFIHVLLWDAREKVNCLEITNDMLEAMD